MLWWYGVDSGVWCSHGGCCGVGEVSGGGGGGGGGDGYSLCKGGSCDCFRSAIVKVVLVMVVVVLW